MTYLSVQYQRYNVLKREEKSMNQRLKLLEERVETLEQQATESDADMHWWELLSRAIQGAFAHIFTPLLLNWCFSQAWICFCEQESSSSGSGLNSRQLVSKNVCPYQSNMVVHLIYLILQWSNSEHAMLNMMSGLNRYTGPSLNNTRTSFEWWGPIVTRYIKDAVSSPTHL